MPKWRQHFHRFAGAFMCMLFAGLGLIGIRSMSPLAHATPPKGLVFVSFLFVAFAAFAIAGQFWFHRRLIAEFIFDGFTLQFRTLGLPQMRAHPVSEIARVRPWRGRSGPLGYVLLFRQGGKVYLEYSVPNASVLVAQLGA